MSYNESPNVETRLKAKPIHELLIRFAIKAACPACLAYIASNDAASGLI